MDSKLEVSLTERKGPEEKDSEHMWGSCKGEREGTILYQGPDRWQGARGGFRRKWLYLNSGVNPSGMKQPGTAKVTWHDLVTKPASMFG